MGDLGSARREIAATLVDDTAYRRNRRSPRCAQAAGVDLNQLCIRDTEKTAVIAYGREIGTLRGLFRRMFLIDRAARNAGNVVVFKGQLNGFLQCNAK